MLYIAFVCIFLSTFLFTYNKNHLSKNKTKNDNTCTPSIDALRTTHGDNTVHGKHIEHLIMTMQIELNKLFCCSLYDVS